MNMVFRLKEQKIKTRRIDKKTKILFCHDNKYKEKYV